jgi:hypothetical protein
MKRLKDPMVTPTIQYEGTIQGNEDAMTAPGSGNRIPPFQNFTVPVDLVPTPDGKGHVEVSNWHDRVDGNPPAPQQLEGGGWTYAGASGGGWTDVDA